MRAIDHPLGLTRARMVEYAEMTPWEQAESVAFEAFRPLDNRRSRERMAAQRESIIGLCRCGCGSTVRSSNGVPSQWVAGHHLRGPGNGPRTAAVPGASG